MSTTGFARESQTSVSYWQNTKQLRKHSAIQLIARKVAEVACTDYVDPRCDVCSHTLPPPPLGTWFTWELGCHQPSPATYLPLFAWSAGTSATRWICALKISDVCICVPVTHLPELDQWSELTWPKTTPTPLPALLRSNISQSHMDILN